VLLVRILITLTCLSLVGSARAQELAPQVGAKVPPSRAWLALGYDKTWTQDVGYARVAWQPSSREALALAGGVRIPIFLLPELDSAAVAVGPSFSWVARSGFGFTASIQSSIRTASDTTGKKVGLALRSELRPGYYGERWALALQLTTTTTFATHMSHSEEVRDLFRDRYPEGQEPANAIDGPRDGWYGLTSHELRVGATGGARLTRSFALYGLGGWTFRRQLGSIRINPPISALPFFVHAGGELRW
jgi:hypothetical protein